MNCTNCGSDSTRKFSVVYEEGTNIEHTEVNAKTKTNYSDSRSTIKGQSRTTSMSELAKKCAPPEKEAPIIEFLGWSFFSLIISLIIAGLSYWLFDTASPGTILFVILILLNIRGFMKRSKFNRTEYPKLKREWDKSWVCLKCGVTFVNNS